MDLKGQQIKHSMWGIGTVIQQEDKHIIIQFADRISKFQYPDAFLKFLKAVNDTVHNTILLEIKIASESERRIEEQSKKNIEEKGNTAKKSADNMVMVLDQQALRSRTVERQQRIPGKRMTFFVFQGNTYDRESRGGYIWAPIFNKNGRRLHHWERLLDVRAGDIILHGYNGYVQAISLAKGSCYECRQPEELQTEKLWDRDGRRVDCDYIHINTPVKTAYFVDDILRLCTMRYAPFDKDGNGNMGYLYEINRELASIFINASVKQNSYLAKIDYIQEILSEFNSASYEQDKK